MTRGQAGTADDFSDGWPFLELYVVPSTLGEPLCTEILEDIDLFKSILSESGVYLPSFELDDDSSSFEISSGREYNAYRASNDAVVAQSFNIDEYGEINPAMTPESVKFFDDGGLKVLLNVPQTRVPDNPGRSWQLFLQKIDGNSENIRFLDGEELVLAIHTVLNSYLRVLEECGWTDRPGRELHFRARTRNGYRTALMFNKPWYRRLINEYGPPISYEDNVTVPFRDTRLLYPTEEGKYDGIVRSIAQILEAFGLPWEEAGRSSEILWDRMWEVIDSRPTE